MIPVYTSVADAAPTCVMSYLPCQSYPLSFIQVAGCNPPSDFYAARVGLNRQLWESFWVVLSCKAMGIGTGCLVPVLP